MNELIQGDCLEKMKDIESGSVDMILTDPPYKMTKRGKAHRPNYMTVNNGGSLFTGNIPKMDDWLPLCFTVMRQNAHMYVFTNAKQMFELLGAAERAGFKLHNIISMIKDTKVPTHWYLNYCEYILFFRKGAAFPINDRTSRNYLTVEMPTLAKGKLHKTQKPLCAIKKLVLNSSKKGENVLDPFMGSGTTGVACKNLNRDFIGIELDENYFNIAKERINNN